MAHYSISGHVATKTITCESCGAETKQERTEWITFSDSLLGEVARFRADELETIIKEIQIVWRNRTNDQPLLRP